MSKSLTGSEIARRIDHTLLKADAARADIESVCDEALRHHFACVCVNGSNLTAVAARLKNSDVFPVAVVGFPLGAGTTNSKVYEAVDAVRRGAREIDMVMNIGALKSKDLDLVRSDIAAVVESVAPVPVKVILETSLLTQAEKKTACELSSEAGAAFVKTSTGFGGGGATTQDVILMRQAAAPCVKVKASGGIRDRKTAQAMIEAGADRLGTSSGVAIVTQADGGEGY